MKKINKTRYAILGMLLEKSQSGYDIKRMMAQSTTHFWQESDASIYPMLKTLEDEKKVKSRSEFIGKRERRIFEITASGKKEFTTWMALPTESGTTRNELLLKLFFGANTTKEEIIKHLNTELAKCQEIKKQFKELENNILSNVSNSYPHKIYWEMALGNGVLSIETELKWLKKCIQKLEGNGKDLS
ncbi:MAG: PadR family transcriptional regulator [Candidatus Babeliales bacterium]|jgi:DNA-binding PadR family transcriptional regulator